LVNKYLSSKSRKEQLSLWLTDVNDHTHDIVLAINRALRYKVYDGRSIENYLQMNVQKKNEITLLQQKNRKSDEQA